MYESPSSVGIENVEIDYTTDNSTNLGKSFSIHQAMKLANDYMCTLESGYSSSITAKYPDGSGTVFDPNNSVAHFVAEDAFDWDVIEHEYGHFVEHQYGIINSPGGDHWSTLNMADKLRNKDAGIRLAWAEGWATYFSLLLQDKMSAINMNIPNVGDTRYQDTDDGNVDYDIEILPEGRKLGEANEASIAAVLLDITDPDDNPDEYDTICCDDKEVWNVTKNSQCKTFSEFINAFNASSYFNQKTRLRLGTIMRMYNISARLNYPTDVNTNTPTFTWTPLGGSTRYANDSFRLAIYDYKYDLILRTSYSSATTKTLTASQWNQVKNSGHKVYFSVEVRQTDSPVTGPYFSNLRSRTFSSGNYKVKNVGADNYLNVYGSNVTSLTNHQNVCLWSDSGSNEQKWYIPRIGEGVYIKSCIDKSFGLNVYRTGSPYNCDLLPVSGNETDAKVDFIAVTGGYKIKLHNYDLYLTANSSSNGANVYWAASSSSNYQLARWCNLESA